MSSLICFIILLVIYLFYCINNYYIFIKSLFNYFLFHCFIFMFLLGIYLFLLDI